MCHEERYFSEWARRAERKSEQAQPAPEIQLPEMKPMPVPEPALRPEAEPELEPG